MLKGLHCIHIRNAVKTHREMNNTATHPVKNYLTAAQIQRYGFQDYKVEYSLSGGMMYVTTADGFPTEYYLKKVGNKYKVHVI